MIKYSFIVKNQQFLTTYKHQYNHNTFINIHITLDHSTHSTSKHELHHHSTKLQIILYNKNPSKKKEKKKKVKYSHKASKNTAIIFTVNSSHVRPLPPSENHYSHA